MEKFDKINFLGRVMIGFYFIISSIGVFQSFDHPNFPNWMIWFFGFMAFWGIVGGLLLVLGVKPRAVSGVLAIILIITLGVEISFFMGSSLAPAHILGQFSPDSSSLNPSNWTSPQVHLFMGRIAILGACLFIAGARKIPHCAMVRSEGNMQNKYGH